MADLYYDLEKEVFNSPGVVDKERRVGYTSDGESSHNEQGFIHVYPTGDEERKDNIPVGSIQDVK